MPGGRTIGMRKLPERHLRFSALWNAPFLLSQCTELRFSGDEVPLHFYGAVHLVRFLEGVAGDTWKQVASADAQ